MKSSLARSTCRSETRSTLVRTLLAGLVLLGAAAAPDLANAQAFPAKPIHFIVPYVPGGATDLLARLAGTSLSIQLKQPVVIENRPGAGGNVGADLVAKAPDGYTIGLFASTNLVMNPFLFPAMPFDALNDFAPVINLCDAPEFLFVPASLGVNSLQEFVALAKSKPGDLNYASAGIGSTPHISADYF